MWVVFIVVMTPVVHISWALSIVTRLSDSEGLVSVIMRSAWETTSVGIRLIVNEVEGVDLGPSIAEDCSGGRDRDRDRDRRL